MFVFGTAEDTARSLCESVSKAAHGLADKPVDEMSVQEMKQSLVLFSLAAQKAREVGSSEESMYLIIDWYDDVLRELVAVDEGMRKHVLSKRFPYPRKRSPENLAYYRAIAEEA